MPVGITEYDDSMVEVVDIRMIRPSKFPVRYSNKKNTQDVLALKESIREHGLLQPILVRPLEYGFEIVAGHRRFNACRSLRHQHILCKIRDLSDKHAYEIQLTENLQRKTLDPIEEAEAYQKYVLDFGWGGVSDLSKKIGKSPEYVSHRMQLLKLSSNIKDRIVDKELNVSQALELVGAPEEVDLVDNIVRNKLTVSQIRQMKTDMNHERTVAPRRRESRSMESQITKRCIFTLKIALSRMDDLIEDAHGARSKEKTAIIEYLMKTRLQLHAMIDETIRFEKERPRAH